MAAICSILVAALLLTACGSISQDMFKINDQLDRAIIAPVATSYTNNVPAPLRQGVTNFFDNLAYTNTIVNQLLQGKPLMAASDTARLVVNTVVGFGGIGDPATALGLEKHDEDVGQTLAVHGFGPGPYFVVPIYGPTTARDLVGTLAGSFLKPPFYLGRPLVAPEDVLLVIDTRAGQDEIAKAIREADDPYEFLKKAYLASRRILIYDGNPPAEDLEKGLEGLDELEDLDEEDLEALEELEDMEGLEDGEDPDDMGDLDEELDLPEPALGEDDAEGEAPIGKTLPREGQGKGGDD
jgi:phospholipid-binding lipoprotein MlaA